jgi:hypothetical protein
MTVSIMTRSAKIITTFLKSTLSVTAHSVATVYSDWRTATSIAMSKRLALLAKNCQRQKL